MSFSDKLQTKAHFAPWRSQLIIDLKTQKTLQFQSTFMSATKVEIVGLARFGLVADGNDEDNSSYSDSFCANSAKLATRRVSTRAAEEEVAKQTEIIQMMDNSMSSIGDDESVSFHDSFIAPSSPIKFRRRSSLDHYNNFQSRRASIGSGPFSPRRKSMGISINNINKMYNNGSRDSMGSNTSSGLCRSQQQYQRSTCAFRRKSLGSSFANDSVGNGYHRLRRRNSLGDGISQCEESSCSNSFANDSLELQKRFKKSLALNNLHTSCSGSIAGISVSSRGKCSIGNRAA